MLRVLVKLVCNVDRVESDLYSAVNVSTEYIPKSRDKLRLLSYFYTTNIYRIPL